MLEVIDKYKFGIVAAFACYLFIFSYTNIITYDNYHVIEPFTDHANIEKESQDEILEITPENIEIPNDFDLNVKNIAQDVNDDREASMTDYSPNMSPAEIEQQIKALEAQMRQEAGGAEERARLEGLIEERKKDREAAERNATAQPNNATPTSTKKYSGQTIVDWDLNGRKGNYIPIPAYTCDAANGVVVVNVKTNANGDVISATHNASASKNETSCMIRKALEYARKSRFEYSTKADQQSGYIKYTFILR